MRGITFTTCLGDGNDSLDKNKFLTESTCDLKYLFDMMNHVKPLLDQFKIENDPKAVYELIYSTIPNNLAEIEKFVCDTANKTDFEIKQSYIKQALAVIKNEIRTKEDTIRYMIRNDIKEQARQTVDEHIDDLNAYRNKFILFNLLS